MPKNIKTAKSKKSRTKKRKAKSSLSTIKVHSHFARAIASVKKFSPDEIEEIKTLASTEFAGARQSSGCWLADTGGPQHCVNLPPDVCARKGGISVPTKCPNA
jgi:hypothetical protein